jgi:hypothetical protein
MQCHRLSIRAGRFLSLFVYTLSCLFLLGCTSTPSLKPSLPLTADQQKIEKSVAVLYSPEFREHKQVAEPYHNKANVQFLIGPASVELFRSVFSRSFEEARELDSLAYKQEDLQGIDVIIEPKIKSFKFYSCRAGHWTYWADIVYEIALLRPDGSHASSWLIKGTGEGSGGSPFDEERTWANPVELAMQDAAGQLAASFRETPEAVRWFRRMSLEGASVPMESQTSCAPRDQSPAVTATCYDGIVSAQASFSIESDPEIEKAQAKLKENGLVALSLYLKNEGKHTLRIRRAEISLASSERIALGPMPCTFFAAAATPYNVRLPNIIGGTGYAALPQLVFALINAGVSNQEERESGNYSATFKKYEFTDLLLKEGDTVKGVLFFGFTPRDLSTTDLFLVVPVVDLDSAIRYVLKVPVQ